MLQVTTRKYYYINELRNFTPACIKYRLNSLFSLQKAELSVKFFIRMLNV